MAITIDGSVFSYIIKYNERLARLNYFIPLSNSIGNEGQIAKDTMEYDPSESIQEDKKLYYQKVCADTLDGKQGLRRLKKQKEGITLGIENIVFDTDELYFVIHIRHTSSLDYDLNFLDLSIANRPKGKRKSVQHLAQAPLFRFHMPSRITKGQTVRLVYVLPKF